MNYKDMAHRLSANFQDVTKYPPKASPRSSAGPYYYDPTERRYVDYSHPMFKNALDAKRRGPWGGQDGK